MFKKKDEAVTDFYEQCFEDFQRKTHESIKNLAKENQELKEKVNELEQENKQHSLIYSIALFILFFNCMFSCSKSNASLYHLTASK